MRSTSWHESVIVASARAAGIEQIASSASVTVRGTSQESRSSAIVFCWQKLGGSTFFFIGFQKFHDATFSYYLSPRNPRSFFLFLFYSFPCFRRLMIHHVNNKFNPSDHRNGRPFLDLRLFCLSCCEPRYQAFFFSLFFLNRFEFGMFITFPWTMLTTC